MPIVRVKQFLQGFILALYLNILAATANNDLLASLVKSLAACLCAFERLSQLESLLLDYSPGTKKYFVDEMTYELKLIDLEKKTINIVE
jgi:hypothetical protein